MSDTLSYAVRYYVTKLTTASNLKIMTKHLNKLNKLRKQDTDLQYKKNRTFIKHTIHNYSLYQLSEKEKLALSFGSGSSYLIKVK